MLGLTDEDVERTIEDYSRSWASMYLQRESLRYSRGFRLFAIRTLWLKSFPFKKG